MGVFLEAFFRASSSVFVAVFNNCFNYLLDRFIANNKKSIILSIFSCSCFYRKIFHFYLLINSVNLNFSSVSNSPLFWTVNVIVILSNSVLKDFKSTTLFVSTFNRYPKDLLSIKVYNTSDFCWYWLCTKLHYTKTTSNTLRLGIFSAFLFCLLIFLCYQIISWFQLLVIITYIHILFWTLIYC